MKRKFWNWVKNEGEDTRTLYLTGEISDETWFGDEVTPKIFKDELMAGSGDITLWINSPGGDVFAAAQIYNMLMDYSGRVTVKIDGLAASAASVIAMAGSQVEMSPVAMMMIHNPITVAIGDSKEMQKAIDMLSEVKESISRLMDAESWFNAKKAVELGFADAILYTEEKTENDINVDAMLFSRAAVTNSLLTKMAIQSKPKEPIPNKVPADKLMKRLGLLVH